MYGAKSIRKFVGLDGLSHRAPRIGVATTTGQSAHLVESAPMVGTRMQNHAERFADRLVISSLAHVTGTALVTADFNRFSNLVIVDDATGIRVSAPTSVLASMTHVARAGTIAGTIKSDSPMERGAAAPLVNGLVSEVASRVGLVVSDKAAASAIPILGAIGGATVNVLFTEHVQTVAEAHVTRPRIERIYRIDRLQPTYAPAARPGTSLAV